MKPSTAHGARSIIGASCSVLLALVLFVSCKNGTPVTATQVVLDSADQVLLGMSHYVTELGVLRARVRADTAYFFSNTQRVELRNVHVTFYDVAGNPTATSTSRSGCPRRHRRSRARCAAQHAARRAAQRARDLL